MIILDTNVISELMRGEAKSDRRVVEWARALSEQPVSTVINHAEILSGLAVLPAGRRRAQLLARAENTLLNLGPALPLTPDCAGAYAAIVAERKAAGSPIGQMDGLIAAIARTTGAAIATRNISDFDSLGLRLVDPWTAEI